MARIRQITFEPNPLVVGKIVTVTLTVEDGSAVESAKLYDPRGYELRFQRVDGADRFTLSETVPYDTDRGTYSATVVVTNRAGEVERKTVEFHVG